MTQPTNETTENLNLNAQLAQFTGGGDCYKHWLGLVYTDGVKFLAKKADAYWLLDSIALYQPKCLKDPMLQEIQFWKLKVKDNSGVLTCERDKNDVFLTENIIYTDFPLEEITLYLENGILCLPSER